MLEYCRVCSTFESVFALPLGVIYYFWNSFQLYIYTYLNDSASNSYGISGYMCYQDSWDENHFIAFIL